MVSMRYGGFENNRDTFSAMKSSAPHSEKYQAWLSRSVHTSQTPSNAYKADSSHSLGRPTKSSRLRQGCHANLLPEVDYNKQIQRQRDFDYRCRAFSRSAEIASREVSMTSVKGWHGYLTGARYNSAHYVDTYVLKTLGLSLPREGYNVTVSATSSHGVRRPRPPLHTTSALGSVGFLRKEPCSGAEQRSDATTPRERIRSALGDLATKEEKEKEDGVENSRQQTTSNSLATNCVLSWQLSNEKTDLHQCLFSPEAQLIIAEVIDSGGVHAPSTIEHVDVHGPSTPEHIDARGPSRSDHLVVRRPSTPAHQAVDLTKDIASDQPVTLTRKNAEQVTGLPLETLCCGLTTVGQVPEKFTSEAGNDLPATTVGKVVVDLTKLQEEGR